MPKPRPTKKAAKATTTKSRKMNDSVAFEAALRKTSESQHYELRLYVTGTSPRSGQAIANIRALCEEHLQGRYTLEVIDIYQQPGVAAKEQIIAAPTLVKKSPAPSRRLIGDLSNPDKILLGLNIAVSKKDTHWLSI